jgi:hypothetical protein
MLNKRIELLAHHHDGHEFPVELAITTLGTSTTTRVRNVV